MAKRAGLKSADELAQVGLRHHRAGDRAQAERSYKAALEREPGHLAGLTLLGTLLMERQDYDEAAALLERATRIAPEAGVLHSNLGEALRRLGQHQGALRAFQRAVEASPDLAEAHYNLGLTLDQLGRLPEAIVAYETALALKQELTKAATALLGALRDSAQYDRAINWYRRVARSHPDSCELRCAVAGALADVFRIDEASEHLEHALVLDPDSARARADYAGVLLERGEVDEALSQLRRATELDPSSPEHQSKLVYALPFSARTTAADVLEAAREFGRRHTLGLPRPASYANRREPERRLRVGYVSPDFREHPAAPFLLSLLRHHDRSQVEVFGYSNVRRPDAVTADLRGMVEHWRDISLRDDDDAAALVRRDEIDILVDLAMHTGQHRLLLFGRKPAPVQVCWLAYPGTTGVAGIDYRITDPQLDPPELGDVYYSEKSILLPHTYWCYAPPTEQPEVSGLPALRNGYITFGSLNSFKKVSDASLELWARVLKAVPESRLVLIAPVGKARERVRRVLVEQEIDPVRLEILGHLPRPQYLELYQRIDICLDPLPYGGGTTSLDACWMGVPVVTLAGMLAAARSGVSIAHNLSLAEVVARSPDDYVRRAANLAASPADLAELRRSLRLRMKQSPLMNAPAFAQHLEAAYRGMWKRWCETPAS